MCPPKKHWNRQINDCPDQCFETNLTWNIMPLSVKSIFVVGIVWWRRGVNIGDPRIRRAWWQRTWKREYPLSYSLVMSKINWHTFNFFISGHKILKSNKLATWRICRVTSLMIQQTTKKHLFPQTKWPHFSLNGQ